MVNIFIQEPIWKNRSVGVNHKFVTSDLAIQILYVNQQNKREYPDVYRMKQEDALKYPIQKIITNKLKVIELHIIPIADLVPETEDQKAEREYMQSQGFYKK